jgi:hypothetical protein
LAHTDIPWSERAMSSGSGGANERATQQPPFDPDVFARESESHIETAPVSKRPTVPPLPSYTNLRDSCREFAASESTTSETAERTKTPTLSAVVDLLTSMDDLAWFNLDARARAIVTVIDGELIVEEILAVTHIDIDTGIAILAVMAQDGIVAFRPRDTR